MGEGVEARFARKLASNDLRIRSKTLRSLKKWMTARSAVEGAFSELEMLKLWRGLFMCMWHSDKPLVQEELAENLASFIHVLVEKDTVLLFVNCFFSIMSREWLSIDRLRLDKFYMLIRRMLRHSFQYLLGNDWNSSLVDSLVQILSEGPLNPDLTKTCSGVQLHVLDVYLPELLTVAANSIPAECSLLLLQPCCHLLAHTRDPVTVQVIEASVLGQLAVGKKAQKLRVEVDVVSERLLQLAVSRDTLGRNRKSLYTLRKRLQEFAASQEVCDQTNDITDEIEGYVRGGKGEGEGEEGGDMETGEGGRGREDEVTAEKRRVRGEKTRAYRIKCRKRARVRNEMKLQREVLEGEEGERVCPTHTERRRRQTVRIVKSRKKLRQLSRREERGEEGEREEGEKQDGGGRKVGKVEDGHVGNTPASKGGGIRDDKLTPPRPRKRVSFGLHKNEIFTPSQ